MGVLRQRLTSLAVGLALATGAGAAVAQVAPVEGDFVVRDFRFRSGETLPELRINYTTLGQPHRNARGEIEHEIHSSLSSERARHGQLKALIGDRLRTDPNTRRKYNAEFKTPPEYRGIWKGTLVRWTRHDA